MSDVPRPRLKRSRSVLERENNQDENASRQLILYGDVLKNNVLVHAWEAYFDKNKIKKNILVCCDLNKICNEIIKGIQDNSLTLKAFSFLLIGVCNIYKKKLHFVDQDFEFLKRKIVTLYKIKDGSLPDLSGITDGKRKRGNKDDDDTNKNKKRLNRASLILKKRASVEEFMPSIINDFGKKRSRFSLNANEISIEGSQHSNFWEFFNENEVGQSLSMDMPGMKSLSYNDHDMEKALEGSFVQRNSMNMNNFDNVNLRNDVSDSMNPVDNIHGHHTSMLNNMIQKNMFPSMDISMNMSSMNDANSLNFNMNLRNEEFGSMNMMDPRDQREIPEELGREENEPLHGMNNLGSMNEIGNMNLNEMNHLNSFKIGGGVVNPFNPLREQSITQPFGSMINNNNESLSGNQFNSMNLGASMNNSGMVANSSLLGDFNNSMNNLYNLNPFINMNTINTQAERRANIPFASKPVGNNLELDTSPILVAGKANTAVGTKKKLFKSKNSDNSNAINFETYQNFDYFDQKDDDGFLQKLNTLLGLNTKESQKKNIPDFDESEMEEEKPRGDVDVEEEGEAEEEQLIVFNFEGDQDIPNISLGDVALNKLVSLDQSNSDQLLGGFGNNEEGDASYKKSLNEGEEIVLNDNEGPNAKRLKTNKQYVDKTLHMKDAIIKGMMKHEKVDYKKFLIDTIQDEITEKAMNEYPAFQFFSLQPSDKMKPLFKFEVNFGYESEDHRRKMNVLNHHLECIANNNVYLHENKVMKPVNVKNFIDNADDLVKESEESSVSNHFLTFQGNDETMRSELNFEQVREQHHERIEGGTQMGSDEFKNMMSLVPMASLYNEQIDLNLNPMNMKDDLGSSKFDLESQVSKSFLPKDGSVVGTESMYGMGMGMSQNENKIPMGEEDKLNSEFTPSIDFSIFSNYDFSNILSKEVENSEPTTESEVGMDININMNQDFDLITKELLETYQNLSKKMNYILFNLVTKHKTAKSEISTLFYITLHLANLGYIDILQKPLLPNNLEPYEDNMNRPILIQFLGKNHDSNK